MAQALAPALERLEKGFARTRTVRIFDPGAAQGLEWLWFSAWSFQVRETWSIHGDWMEAHCGSSRVLSRETFAAAADSTEADSAGAHASFRALRTELRRRVPAGAALCIPTLSDLPPLRDAGPEAVGPMLRATLCLMSIAGIAGLPQVHLPVAELDGCPLGLSLVGPAASDERLLSLPSRFADP